MTQNDSQFWIDYSDFLVYRSVVKFCFPFAISTYLDQTRKDFEIYISRHIQLYAFRYVSAHGKCSLVIFKVDGNKWEKHILMLILKLFGDVLGKSQNKFLSGPTTKGHTPPPRAKWSSFIGNFFLASKSYFFLVVQPSPPPS